MMYVRFGSDFLSIEELAKIANISAKKIARYIDRFSSSQLINEDESLLHSWEYVWLSSFVKDLDLTEELKSELCSSLEKSVSNGTSFREVISSFSNKHNLDSQVLMQFLN